MTYGSSDDFRDLNCTIVPRRDHSPHSNGFKMIGFSWSWAVYQLADIFRPQARVSQVHFQKCAAGPAVLAALVVRPACGQLEFFEANLLGVTPLAWLARVLCSVVGQPAASVLLQAPRGLASQSCARRSKLWTWQRVLR